MNFKSRLNDVFGSLGSTTGAPSWSVSSQVERRQWRTESESDDEDEVDEKEASCSKAQIEQPQRAGVEDEEDDELMEVRRMVGMDTTLDSEDEEDAYDQVALGREDVGDRIYMSSLNEEESHTLPSVFHNLQDQKDSRALHKAAADRLAEDAEEAKQSGSDELYRKFSKGGKANEKRKQDNGKMDIEKRVRFLVPESGEKTKSTKEARSIFRDRYKNVPDHVRHPEKYTHYTLDWSEEDHSGANNVKAWHDAVAAAKSPSECEATAVAPELPQHITFVPRSSARKEKDRDCVMVDATPGVNITAEMDADDENGAEDDSSRFKIAKTSTGRRSYRKRSEQDE